MYMGRPKGSKNKSTLEKEKKGRFTLSEKTNPLENGKVLAKFEFPEQFEEPSETALEAPVSDSIPEEVNTQGEVESPSHLEQQPAVTTTKIKSKGKEKKLEGTPCERCGKLIYSEPKKIDTNILTGTADYYRNATRFVRMCNPCCDELSQMVDKWLCDPQCGGNPNLNRFNKKE